MKMISILCLSLCLLACSLVSITPTGQPKPDDTPLSLVLPSATPFAQEMITIASPTEAESTQPTETLVPEPTSPTCTILQDLNLRSGPGTAYRPPILILPAQTMVVPLGFNPVGIPGGSWVYVEVMTSGQKGWVSAGRQYISCGLDLSNLPAVAVGTPPPPPLPQSALSSTPDGSCRDEGLEYVCEVVFLDESWLQFKILRNGRELGQADGVEQVSFTVIKDGNTVYQITEHSKDYCIFGGNGPCNPWEMENAIYHWPGGAKVQPGEYLVNIEAVVNGTTLTWHATFRITLP